MGIINYENLVKYFVKEHFPGIHKMRGNYKREKYSKNTQAFMAEQHSYYLANGRYPLFGTIEIETLNRCNSTCSFCPVNRNDDTREYKKMDEPLFKKILEDLKSLNYQGSIGLYSNNEPFLDERICDFAKTAKEILPENRLYLYTNGTLLTIEKFVAIMKYLDNMYIDNYNDALKLIVPNKKIFDFCKNNVEYKDRVRIRLRKLHDVLTTRGGQAPNRTENSSVSLECGCKLPFRQMVVRPDGKVSLCCNDALGKYTVGDLTKESIHEVWHKPILLETRANLLSGRNTMTGLCQHCDSLL